MEGYWNLVVLTYLPQLCKIICTLMLVLTCGWFCFMFRLSYLCCFKCFFSYFLCFDAQYHCSCLCGKILICEMICMSSGFTRLLTDVVTVSG